MENNKTLGYCVCIAAVVVVVLLVIVLVVYMRSGEKFVGSMHQVCDDHPDPNYCRYTYRARDVLGNSSEDYYYENKLDYENHAAPARKGWMQYENNTGYLSMPRQFRPPVPAV